MSQHIGDLSSIESLAMLESMSEQMCRLYQSSPEIIASDQHPAISLCNGQLDLQRKTPSRMFECSIIMPTRGLDVRT